MKRIILHIGQQKTGSTALQNYLSDHRKQLEEKAIAYYKPCFRYGPWSGESNGDFLLANILTKLKEPTDSDKKEMFNKNDSLNVFYIKKKNCNNECFETEKDNFIKCLNQYDTIILSEEMFFHYDYFYDNYWQNIYDYLISCSEEKLIIDIIVYLRRQDEWLLSKWKEDIRNQIPSPWGFNETLNEYEQFGFLNYYDTLLRIEKVFKKQHLIIRNYDFDKLYNNNIIEDFFNSCNIEYQLEDTHKYKEINTGQTLKTAYAMVAINKGIVRCNIDRGKLYNATNICFALSDKTDRRAQALTNSERLDLLNRCKESNDNISRHFFNNVDFFDSNIYTELKDDKVLKPDTFIDKLYARLLIFVAKHTYIIRKIFKIKIQE